MIAGSRLLEEALSRLLVGLRDSRLAAPPLQRAVLAPVWAAVMVQDAAPPASATARPETPASQ